MNFSFMDASNGAASAWQTPFSAVPTTSHKASPPPYTPPYNQRKQGILGDYRVEQAARKFFVDSNTSTNTSTFAQLPTVCWRLLELIPKEQRTEDSLPRCTKLTEGRDADTKEGLLKIVSSFKEADRQAFIRIIEPLAGLKIEGSVWLSIIALVQWLPEHYRPIVVSKFASASSCELRNIGVAFMQIASLPMRNQESLKKIAPKIFGATRVIGWANFLKLAASVFQVNRESDEDYNNIFISRYNNYFDLLDSEEDSSVKMDSLALFEFLPKYQRNEFFLKSLIEGLKKSSAEEKFLDRIKSLGQAKEELRIGLVTLVCELPGIEDSLKKLPAEGLEDIGAAIERFPRERTGEILKDLAKTLARTDILDWPKFFTCSVLFYPLKELAVDWNPISEGIALLGHFPEQRQKAIFELMGTASFEELAQMVAVFTALSQEKKCFVRQEVMPTLCTTTKASDIVHNLQLVLLLSYHEVMEEEGKNDHSSIKKAVDLLNAVEDSSVQRLSLALFGLLPDNQRDLARFKLCIKMASNQDNEMVESSFKKIPLDKRSVLLELLASKVHLMGELWIEDTVIQMLANLPAGEEQETVATLEQAIPALREVEDPYTLHYIIKLFGLLKLDQRDLSHLEICISLLSDISGELALGEAYLKYILKIVASLGLEERGGFLEKIISLTKVKNENIRANAIGLFALLPENQRNEEHWEICINLLNGSCLAEGKEIVEAVKQLAVSERLPFLKVSASKLQSTESVWFKKDILALFGSLLKGDRSEVNLQHCITLLSGSAKIFERDLIVEAVKKVPEARRAAFVSGFAQLFRIENMLERARKVQELAREYRK